MVLKSGRFREFKKFAVDTFSYMSFWAGFSYLINVQLIGISFEKYIASSIIGFILSLALGGVFGRYIDFCRKKLLRDEPASDKESKQLPPTKN